jgi:hypothetical protein
MTDNVVHLRPAKDPDHVLEQAVGVYDQVFVIGYDKDGGLDVRASLNFQIKDVFFAIEAFKFRVLNGDYGHRLQEVNPE